jgi:predicted small secreted protein
MFKRIILTSLLAAALLYISGCQTMHGLGGDIKWTGEQVEAVAANCTIPPDSEQATSN